MAKRFITPAYAQQLIDECTHDPELMTTLMRPIRPRHVAFLARQMERGGFGNNVIDVASCLETCQTFILNGNHTLRAIVKSGVSLRLSFEQTSCDTLDDVRRAYSQYDRGLSRTRADALRALNAGGGMDIPLTSLGYLASAVAFILDDFLMGGPRPTRMLGDDELFEEVCTWADEYQLIRNTVGGVKSWESRIIRRRGVLAVALVTARANPKKASTFWSGVVSGVNVPSGSPILKLRDYLMETGVSGGGFTTAVKQTENANDFARTVAHCWSKYIADQPIRRLQVPQGPVTVLFASV